jgi:hypothetical protein
MFCAGDDASSDEWSIAGVRMELLGGDQQRREGIEHARCRNKDFFGA